MTKPQPRTKKPTTKKRPATRSAEPLGEVRDGRGWVPPWRVSAGNKSKAASKGKGKGK
jgi:hypothetical protein